MLEPIFTPKKYGVHGSIRNDSRSSTTRKPSTDEIRPHEGNEAMKKCPSTENIFPTQTRISKESLNNMYISGSNGDELGPSSSTEMPSGSKFGDIRKKTGLRGVGAIWYLRYLEEGLTSEDAKQKVLDRVEISSEPKKRSADEINAHEAQTAVREVVGTTDGHDELISRVTSDNTSTGFSSCKDTAKVRQKPSKEGLKAKAQYKAAVKICGRLEGRSHLSKDEKERLAWAKNTVENGRAHFATRTWCIPSDPQFANSIEEGIVSKLQRSTERDDKARTLLDKAKGLRSLAFDQPTSSTGKMCPSKILEYDIRDKNKTSIVVANNIVSEPKISVLPEKKHRSKRPTSLNESQNVVKRPKTHNEEANVDSSHVIAVIDGSNDDGRISEEKWVWVEVGLAGVFMKVLNDNPGPPPICKDAGWYEGHIKLIKCADKRSAFMYKSAVALLGEVWPGAQLEAVDEELIPSRLRVRVCLPAAPSDAKSIISIFKASNPDIPTHNWKITRIDEPKGPTREVVLVLTPESLELIVQSKGVVNYGFGSVVFEIIKKGVASTDKKSTESTATNTSNVVIKEEVGSTTLSDTLLGDSENCHTGMTSGIKFEIPDTYKVAKLSVMEKSSMEVQSGIHMYITKDS